ncbi:MAG TPA: LytTR family DNA-binding domain-containing protein [Cyclobacteriaceae bacterium]|nr:LytTR family transcriptional regulator [Cyclobacteriaceae bacterium]HRK55195.1 LytTR family DNA-binding domain-containing protein [Cyclobacteriaceae bacterium]
MEAVFARIDKRHLKIQLDSILYLEAAGSYLKLVTLKEEFSLSQNLSQFIRRNDIPVLIRIHRSYIINLNKVDSFDNESVYIRKNKIPISNSYREEFLSRVHCL